jgi:hypothetical protein
MNITDTKTIVDFLRGEGTDHILRSYDDMLSVTDLEMEKCHDQIQWMFPLHEFSKHAKTCPIITPETVAKAQNHLSVRDNLLRATDRMEKFFGIGLYEDRDKQRQWCKNHNHNLLRVTRIIRCLRLFGMEEAAEDFYNKVVPVGEYFGVSSFTLSKWQQALTDNVWNTLQD